MPTGDSRTAKLLTLKSNEEAKGRSFRANSPAIFRETALDTHNTMQPEYFGPRVIAARPQLLGKVESGSLRTTRSQRSAAEALSRTAQLAGPGEVRSVFQPTREQQPVCAAAAERRANVANSEWALLDTMEVALFLDEKELRGRLTKAAQAAQREALDVQTLQGLKKQLAAEMTKERERDAEVAVQAGVMEERRLKDAEQRAANARLRGEREQMLREARKAKEAALDEKRREDARMAAETRAMARAAEVAEAERAAAKRDAAARAIEENGALQAARREAEARRKQEDEETSRRMMEMMAERERGRDGHAEAFQKMVAARARGAGQKALDDQAARRQREERLIAEAAREAARRDAERVAAEADKRARQKAEMIAVNEELKRAKADRLAAERDEERKAKDRADAATALERAEADRRAAALHERTVMTKRVVANQMEETRRKALGAGVGMTEQERLLNLRLLEAAHATVVRPQQLSVKLYPGLRG